MFRMFRRAQPISCETRIHSHILPGSRKRQSSATNIRYPKPVPIVWHTVCRTIKALNWIYVYETKSENGKATNFIRTNWSELFSWLELLFWWFELARGGVDDEHAFMLGGVDVGELPEQPIPLTVCWYIIESPAQREAWPGREKKTQKNTNEKRWNRSSSSKTQK